MPTTVAILPTKVLPELYAWLISRAMSRGVSREIAEELANDTLLVAAEKYRQERGELRPFCARVLGNKIKNHKRSKRVITEEFDEVLSPDVDDPLKILLDREKITKDKEFISRLLSTLDEKERRFLVKYLETLEELEKRAVSETARRLGLPEGEGAAIMKRIARKALKLEMVHAANMLRGVVRESIRPKDACLSLNINELKGFESHQGFFNEGLAGDPPNIENWLNSVSFNKFWGGLRADQRERLASFG